MNSLPSVSSCVISNTVNPIQSASSDVVNTLPSTPSVPAPLLPASSTQPDLVVCPYCQKTFKKKGLANHVKHCKLKNEHQKRLSTSMPLNNPDCDMIGASQVSTKVISLVFNVFLMSSFKCNLCDVTFKAVQALRTHQKFCKGPPQSLPSARRLSTTLPVQNMNQCQYCGDISDTPTGLKVHMYRHHK